MLMIQLFYVTVDSPNDSQKLQQDLDRLQKWKAAWEMDFNSGTYQVLHTTRSRNPIQIHYTLYGHVLEIADHAKYIGIDISSNLSWNYHIDRTATNAGKALVFFA